MNVVFLKEAELELNNAIDFYEGQLTGLGDRFFKLLRKP